MEVIQEFGPWFVGLALLFGSYMCWGIGANDVANAMGTSVGSKAVSIKTAIIIAAVFEFAGVVIAGGHVTETIRKGIVDPTPLVGHPELLVLGMLASLLAAAIWLMVASAKGWPVSTTHSIVGALVGFALVGVGSDAVKWSSLTGIVSSWVVSPVVGGLFAFILTLSVMKLVLNTETPFANAKKWGPYYLFLVGFVIGLVTLFKGLKHLKLNLTVAQSFLAATAVGGFIAFIGWLIIRRIQMDPKADKTFHFASVEKVFGPLQVFTACAMAFAHGSNDVANGVGPLASVYGIVQSGGEIVKSASLPFWILLLGGIGIVVGLATLGVRVIKTIGEGITELTPSRGFCAELAAACTVVLASRTGLPVSTTHIAVGAVMGVGMARGIAALDLRVVGQIVVSWLITIPVGAVLSALIFFLLRVIFL
ncbi:MAG: inorganic phosphate transporter [Acidobacteria bacterium]|nr:inorganic phosphate transporter [Acidobacteriota bacterium]MCB9398697.1 inorganic phosphate transporter [Acidobacteriota bacterium]